MESIQEFFGYIANFLESIIFFNVLFFTPYKMPIAIFVLLVGVIYFTISLRFINFRFIGKSIQIFFEKEKEKDGNKAVTSRAAFVSAISGCVGLGNISGVAAAIFAGGPGAIFWMLLAGFLVMPLRYAEVFLGHFFRTKEKDGTISKYGPYAYIETGLVKEGYSKKLSKFFFIFYVVAMLCGVIGALIFQVNPLTELTGSLLLNSNKGAMFLFCVALAALSIFVVVGGLKRIVHTMEGAVSVMSFLYVASILLILVLNFKALPGAIGLIFTEAFNIQSIYGGILGVIIVSITRVLVATEVGFGSVSFLHGKSQNDDSVREGLLSMAGPLFGNFVFVTLNSIAVIATASHLSGENGILMIVKMFASVHPYFPFVLFVAAFLFAFTTIIAWYFYGESTLRELTQNKFALLMYRIFIFVLISVSGIVSFGVILRVIDPLILSMVFPNVLALLLLGGVVRREFLKYTSKNKL